MTDLQEVKRKTIQGALGYALRTLALQGIGFAATIALGYFLTPEEFGVFFIVSAIVGLFTFLSDVGLAAALVQKSEPPSVAELRTTFTVQQGLAVLIFLLLLLLTPIWRTRGLTDEGLWLLYALGFSFILASLKTIPSILLERKLEFGKLVWPQIAENIAFYGLVVFLASRGMGVQSYTYGVLLRGVVGFLVIAKLQWWPIGFDLQIPALKKLLHFGVKFQVNDLLARIKDDLLVVVIAGIVGPQNMGYVSWAKRWSMFPYQLGVNSMLSVVFPSFSRLQDNPMALKKAIEKAVFFISLGVFPLLAILCGLAEPALLLIPRYEKWLPALPSFYLFALNIGWSAVTTPLTNTLNAVGMIDKTLRLMVMWTVLGWVLTPLFVWWFGFVGVALASAVIAPTSLLAVRLLKKSVQVNFFDAVWRQMSAAGAVFLALFLLREHLSDSLLQVVFAGFLSIGAYVAFMFLFGKNKVLAELHSLRIR